MSVRDGSVMAAIGLACLAPGCWAQFVGPIPPAAAPTREYVAPESRAPAPIVAVPEVEPLAPSIVQKDENGRVKALAGAADEAAVAAYSFDAARRERVARVAAARKLDLDRFVIMKLDKVLAAKKMRATVESTSNFDELFKARDLNVSLGFERLVDRLERDRAITTAQRVRLDETVKNYENARQAQIKAETGGDPTRTAILTWRQTFADVTLEPLESLERQMDDAARNFWKMVDGLTLSADQRRELEKLRGESKPGNIDETNSPEAVKRVREFMDAALDLEQRRALMSRRLAERAK